ncbi:MAG: diguanylate cyclase [Deltaproteobacteria bacterium]|nr:diguanylate cyclase [Deltaproteobacteria bacterium]
MSESYKELEKQLARLIKENLALRNTCRTLKQTQAEYEQLIGQNNVNILRSDMARMELEQVFSAYLDPMWVVREDRIVLRANKAMLTMLDKPHTEVVGKPCSSLLSYAICNQHICPIKTIKDQQTHEFDVQLADRKTRDKHYLLTTAPLVTLDGTPGIVAQFKDITSRKKAEKVLEKMARVDGLTQISNRRCFDEIIEKEWQRLQRTEKPLALLLGDIDYFKKYNDHYGHQAGDDCLRQVAQALATTAMRPPDLVARYGGEEFVLLLPEVDLSGAMHVAKRALNAIAQKNIAHEKSDVSSLVSLSIGAATLVPSQQATPATLIAMADDALYQAKEAGRNRVVPAAGSRHTNS